MYGSDLGNNTEEARSADMMAAMGRGNDSMMAHTTPGEIMIPPEVWNTNPKLQAAIRKAFLANGVNPAEFMAGSPYQKINPITGQPEFGFFKSLFKIAKKVVPVALGYALTGTPIGAAIGGAAGSALRGGNLSQILQGASYGFGAGSLANAGISALSSAAPSSGGILWNAPGVTNAASTGINWAPAGQSIGASSTGFGSIFNSANNLLSSVTNNPLVSGLSKVSQLAQIASPFMSSQQRVAPTGGVAQLDPGATPGVPTAIPQAQATTFQQGAGPAPFSPAAPGGGVSYMDKLRNRETGQVNYSEAPFSSALSNSRRGGWGNTIFA